MTTGPDRRQPDPAEALRQSEERFRLLVETVRDYAIFMLDPHGRVTSWNDGAQRIKGYTAEEIIGTHFSAFYTPEQAASGHPDRELELARRDGRYEEEGWRVRKDGSRFWANVVITALRDDGGQLVGFAKVTRDVTDQRAAQQELRRAHEDLRARAAELERSNRDLDDFASIVGHDLATPLQIAGGFVHVLRTQYEGALDERGVEHLDRIGRAVERAQAMLHDVLTYARAGTAPAITDVELTAVVERAVAMLQARLDDTGGTIEVGPLPTVRGDESQLEQLFENVLGNAVKFARPETPPRVAVSARRAGGGWELSIADNGIGVPADKRTDAFVMFRRLDSGGARPGTGIGLAICKKIVERHNGDIWLEASPLGGTDVRIRLPAG